MIAPKLPIKVGILGSGQLARMLALAAHNLGVRPFIFADKASDCACQVTSDIVLSTEPGALEKFFSLVDIVTIENEFLDLAKTAMALEKTNKTIFPTLKTLGRLQSKLDQKESLLARGLPTLEFMSIASHEDLDKAWNRFKGKLVLKTARFGYDGKGTFLFSGDKKKWNAFKGTFVPGEETWGYAEPLASYKKELAVMVARDQKGNTLSYPVTETFQAGGICQWTSAPAAIPAATSKLAQQLARKVITTFNGVGVFGVEMFFLETNKLVINEIAPRVHNSGHWTLNGTPISQFEQHLRAGLGLPLGGATPVVPHIAMVNIIGKGGLADINDGVGMGSLKSETPVWIHWYGKQGKTLGRKLGHVNSWGTSASDALKKATAARKRISV